MLQFLPKTYSGFKIMHCLSQMQIELGILYFLFAKSENHVVGLWATKVRPWDSSLPATSQGSEK